jgi:hypothetical protein
MSLIQTIFEAVRSWRRRRDASKRDQRAGVTVERLDHRQLLSVNFTGNVATDFPATLSPGVVILPAAPGDQIAQPDQNLAPLIRVSGFNVNAIRVSYDPLDDTLNFGLEQPDNQKTGTPVIAGDADNNGNSGTVDPAVQLIDQAFQDPPDLDGTETMGVFLDLNNDSVPDIIAGKDQADPRSPKLYQVAVAIPNSNPGARPAFGAPLPANTGNVYLVNQPNHPNFEFTINRFTDLFRAFNNGAAPTPESVLKIGAFAGSLQDGSTSETFINLKPTPFGPTVLPNPCPPVEPPIQINPHQHRHVNTAHPSDVRVSVFGSAGFDVDDIVPESLRLGGAAPIFDLPARQINRDKYPDKTFVFRGSDIDLPPGVVDAVLTGRLEDGTEFASTYEIFNRTSESYPPAALRLQEQRREQLGPIADLTPFQRRLFHRDLALEGIGGQPEAAPAPVGDAGEGVAPARASVKIAMTHRRQQPVTVDSGVVAIPTRPGSAPVRPRKLKVEMGTAAMSH